MKWILSILASKLIVDCQGWTYTFVSTLKS